ncbi:MAG: PAS domain S-box protein [Anaerolineaceae bacterium]|nr:PAS domain S-box protein [Anaerolineaceae bacterium]
MSISTDFYTLVSSMLYQAVHNPGKPPVVPLDQYRADSNEQRLLVDLQKTLASIRAFHQDELTHLEQEGILYQCVFDSSNCGLIINDIDTSLVLEANDNASSMHGYTRDEFIGLPATAYIHPDNQDLFDKCIETIQAGEVFKKVAVHICRDGSLMFVDLRVTQCMHEGRLCLLAIVCDMNDINDKIIIARQIQQQVNLHTRELSTLLEISHTLSSTLMLDPDLILTQLRKIINFTHAELFIMEENSLVSLGVCGSPRIEQAVPIRVNVDSSHIAKFLSSKEKIVCIGNVWSNDPQAIFLRSFLKDQAIILLEGIQSLLWIPLVVKGKMLGGLSVAHTKADYFTEHHIDLVMDVANQAAITIVNTELYHQAQEFTSLQVRQRIARNLHDAVNQSLFSASLIAEVLPQLWERKPQEGRQSLIELQRLTKSAMAEMRMMMAELRPMALSEINFADLLGLLGDAFTGRTNIPVSLNSVGKISFPPDVQTAFYRICQESLNNIAKYANANQVMICLQHSDNLVDLCIRDNGCGFDTGQIPQRCYGISIMRERAEAVGAVLTIRSELGQGTEVAIQWKDDSGGKML